MNCCFYHFSCYVDFKHMLEPLFLPLTDRHSFNNFWNDFLCSKHTCLSSTDCDRGTDFWCSGFAPTQRSYKTPQWTKPMSLHLLDGFFLSSSSSWIRRPDGLHSWFISLPLKTERRKEEVYSESPNWSQASPSPTSARLALSAALLPDAWLWSLKSHVRSEVISIVIKPHTSLIFTRK